MLTLLNASSILCVQPDKHILALLRMNHSIHWSLVLFDSGAPRDDPRTDMTASPSCA